MYTLGIETSCDETAVAVLDDDNVLANIVSSQITHGKYGGVVPELAARNHIKVIMPITTIALEVAGLTVDDIGLCAATYGPGLIGALLVGMSYCKSLCLSTKIPFVGVNHLEGHVYALQLKKPRPEYPYLVLLVSGGHTEIIIVKEEFSYETLGKTLDDACGEAFDKVAKLMGLPYPGGPFVEQAAKKGMIGAVKFPVPKVDGLNFSYAGLKTAVLYYTRDNPEYQVADVAANFQHAAIEHLIDVTTRALKTTGVSQLGIVGGVAMNTTLHTRFTTLTKDMGVTLYLPDLQYCTDNAAMIGLAGVRRFRLFGQSDIDLDVIARQSLDAVSALTISEQLKHC
jgi:N6-L-threonylcarbamoyladenine synthase